MKKMTKLLVALLLIATSFTTPISANKEISSDEMQEQINAMEQKYMQEHDIKNHEDFTNEQILELVDLINEYKSNVYSNNDIAKKQTRGLHYHSGDIFVTLDASKTFFEDVVWDHGHAGIGGWIYGDVIEANPGDGVNYYNNRYGYWNSRKNGGVYKVRNAVDPEYETAMIYAEDRVGLSYGFDATSDQDFYCSELVYYAWKDAGYDLDNNRIPGTFILPKYLMMDADVVLDTSFPNGSK